VTDDNPREVSVYFKRDRTTAALSSYQWSSPSAHTGRQTRKYHL